MHVFKDGKAGVRVLELPVPKQTGAGICLLVQPCAALSENTWRWGQCFWVRHGGMQGTSSRLLGHHNLHEVKSDSSGQLLAGVSFGQLRIGCVQVTSHCFSW